MNQHESPARLPKVAYFSMEVGLEPSMPTYSGGLGVLAGDTLRAAADLGVRMVGVSLLYRKGYFRQHLDGQGNQTEDPAAWTPGNFLEPLTPQTTVTIEGRTVRVKAWQYSIKGVRGHIVPVYFLDTYLPDNDPRDQALTDHLYGGDKRYRLAQEVVLGLGGVGMLRALGHRDVQVYHMNEGHSALLTVAHLGRETGVRSLAAATEEDKEAVRHSCVFTTHTPVAAGHDRFPREMAQQVLGEEMTEALERTRCCLGGELNMTYLALVFSRYVNGVSMRHEDISQDMFPSYPINSITNGVHAATWTAAPFRRLFDRHFPEWRYDNQYLRYAVSIPLEEIRQAHLEAERALLAEVERRTGVALDPKPLTLCFARRATPYKRADMLFTDLDRLRRIAAEKGPFQVIFAGKAHPRDGGGKDLIRKIHQAAASLEGAVRVIYLEDYDMELGGLLCSGADVWLNNPLKPREASGTSGMKAAMNGVPSLSVLDGWWIEGCVEGVTGWSIGESWRAESDPAVEVPSLYDKLENVILPLYYGDPDGWALVQRSAIGLNGSFFNAQRMLVQYLRNAYLPQDREGS